MATTKAAAAKAAGPTPVPGGALQFNQIAQLLADIASQAQGKKILAPTTSGEFISVAQTTLLTGYADVITAINQVLSKTIFSVRPYYAKFPSLRRDAIQWGNHVRKLQMVDGVFEDNQEYLLEDGKSVDQFVPTKNKVLQTNFYGGDTFVKKVTVEYRQLDVAFSGPDEFQRYLGMVMQNAKDQIEQAHESMSRLCIANMIASKIIGDTDNVLHLVTMYNTFAGTSFTSATVKQPGNWEPFIRWFYGYMNTLSEMMTERSVKYHMNVTGSEVMRHTPKQMQRLYLATSDMNQVVTQALANTFHENLLDIGEYETVNFWQSISSPLAINTTPSYMGPAGTIVTPEAAVAVNNVMGLLWDVEALGMTTINTWSAPSPFNALGGYSNIFYHFTDRYWNDFTENAVVLMLD